MAGHGVPRVSGGATDIDKSEHAREKRRKAIDAYQRLVEDVKGRIATHDYTNPTLQLTSTLLTQNPEYYTIWNWRRLILQDVFAREQASTSTTTPPNDSDIQAAEQAQLTPAQREILLLITEDLSFLIPLLKGFPKCYWIWNHRAWLLATATTNLPVPAAKQLWRTELGLVSKMLALDSRNFHGWGYRREVIGQLEKFADLEEEGGSSSSGKKSLVEAEFAYTTQMITTNLSNFSAWHYRGQLLPRLLSAREATSTARQSVFDDELALITRALYTDPYDQSLWFYHQFLMSTMEDQEVRQRQQQPGILESVTLQQRKHYFRQELENVRDMLDGAEDCKYIYQALLEYGWQNRQLEAEGDEEVAVSKEEMKGWLSELKKLDKLRAGRWADWEKKLELRT